MKQTSYTTCVFARTDVPCEEGKCLLFFPGTKASMPDARTLHTAGAPEGIAFLKEHSI